MVKNKYKLIVIIGNVGVGKSTLANILAKKLNAVKIPADDLYKTNPFFNDTVKDRKRWSLTSDLWFLKKRVELAEQYPFYLKENHVVVDSGISMSWVYSNSRLNTGHYNKDEWNLYQIYFDLLTVDLTDPDYLIYLKADVNFLMNRIKKRNRKFEIKFFTVKYLSSLTLSLEKYIKTIHKKTKTITLDLNRDILDENKIKQLCKKIIF